MFDQSMTTALEAKPTFAWDEISPNDLRPLGGKRPMTTEFGYLFRHYWTTGNEICYRTETHQVFSDGEECFHFQTTSRTLARCNADICLWRERMLEESRDDGLLRFSPSGNEEIFCEYNRSKQTFQTKPVLAHDFQQVTEEEAQVQAFLRQPIMAPLLPIPLGFQWHVKSEFGQFDYTLESATKVDGSTILFVRRKGFITLSRFYFYKNYAACEQRLFLDREGLTAYEAESSLVLKDRTRDRIRTDTLNSVAAEMEICTTTQLI